MKRIGLFYGKNTLKSAEVATKIRAALGENVGDYGLDLVALEDAWKEDFEACDVIIAGASTWFDGELPTYWDELLPALKTAKLKDKKVALFGLGDQVNYPDNFVDGLGFLVDVFKVTGATLIGSTSTDGYTFNQSKAVIDGKFAGLVLDLENQADLTDARIKAWVESIKKEL
jgi:flavodoxin I